MGKKKTDIKENEKEKETTDFVEDEISKVESLEKEVEELRDQLLRNRAELENFKKRITEERIRDRKYAPMAVLETIITPIEMLDKATSVELEDETLKNWLFGFKMIKEQFMNALETEGVKYIEVKERMFDPKIHQAIEVEFDEIKEEGAILEELSKGYMFKDRILKPSLVKINKKEEKEN